MAKSEYGLPPKSRSTKRLISREEEELRLQLAYGEISKITFNRRMKELELEGKLIRRR